MWSERRRPLRSVDTAAPPCPRGEEAPRTKRLRTERSQDEHDRQYPLVFPSVYPMEYPMEYVSSGYSTGYSSGYGLAALDAAGKPRDGGDGHRQELIGSGPADCLSWKDVSPRDAGDRGVGDGGSRPRRDPSDQVETRCGAADSPRPSLHPETQACTSVVGAGGSIVGQLRCPSPGAVAGFRLGHPPGGKRWRAGSF